MTSALDILKMGTIRTGELENRQISWHSAGQHALLSHDLYSNQIKAPTEDEKGKQ